MTHMRLPADMELMFFWIHRLNLYFLDEPVVDHDEDVPSQLSADRMDALRGWQKPRLRRLAYRLHMGVCKRVGFRRLVRGISAVKSAERQDLTAAFGTSR